MQLKYKLFGSVIAFIGANSTAVPFVWKNSFSAAEEKSYINSLPLKGISLVSNEIINSPSNKERISFVESNRSNYLELNNSNSLNMNFSDIKLEKASQLEETNLVEISTDSVQDLSINGSIKKIKREIKREKGAAGIGKDHERILKAVSEDLKKFKEDYRKALESVKNYNKEAEEEEFNYEPEVEEKELENFINNCVQESKTQIIFCYSDKSNQISKLDQNQRLAIREFFKSYVNLQERSNELLRRLKNGNQKIEIKKDSEKLIKEEDFKKLMQSLKEIHWEKEDILYKYGKKIEEAPFGWKDWNNNPFSSLFDKEIEWKIHILRIIENEKNKKEKKENFKDSLESIQNEIQLLIAVRLLKKMNQLDNNK